MILGLGADLADVRRVAKVLRRHPERFPARLLSPSEQAEFARNAHPARFLARRFAAKEAFLKAMGTGLSGGMRWQDVVVEHNAAGAPALRCGGRAGEYLSVQGQPRLHLSLTDDGDYALAFVVIETGDDAP